VTLLSLATVLAIEWGYGVTVGGCGGKKEARGAASKFCSGQGPSEYGKILDIADRRAANFAVVLCFIAGLSHPVLSCSGLAYWYSYRFCCVKVKSSFSCGLFHDAFRMDKLRSC
jgi:hypothetical protein